MVIIRLRVQRQIVIAGHGCHNHWAWVMMRCWLSARPFVRLVASVHSMGQGMVIRWTWLTSPDPSAPLG